MAIPPLKILSATYACPVCQNRTTELDTLDFNKSCEELRGYFLPHCGRDVIYHLCHRCGFCFSPEFSDWSRDDFSEYIYNADYISVDPDCSGHRAHEEFLLMEQILGGGKSRVKHLDYGAGQGLLTEKLNSSGWTSIAYDPFFYSAAPPSTQSFDLVTAFEVFEHVVSPDKLMCELSSFLKPDGLLFFSTLLSDGYIKKNSVLDWWYAAPRNGHISLFSKQSLELLMRNHGFTLVSLNQTYHYAYAGKPPY